MKKINLNLKKQSAIADIPEIEEIQSSVNRLINQTHSKERTKNQACNDAADGIPAADIQGLSLREQTIKTNCKGVHGLCIKKGKTAKKRIEKELTLKSEKLAAIDPNKNADYFYNKHFKSDRETAYNRISAKHDGKFITKNEEKETTNKDLQQSQAAMSVHVEQNNGKRPIPRLLDKTLFYCIILFLLAAFDVPIHFVALNTLGYFTGTGVLMLSVGLAITFVLTAHEIGKSWQKKDWWRLGLGIISAILLLALVAYLRMGMDDLIMVSLNGVIVLLGISFSYERSCHREFFISQRITKNCRRRINRIEEAMKMIEQKALKEKQDVDKTYWEKSEHLANDKRKKLEQEIEHKQIQLREIDAFVEEKISAIDNFCAETIQLYRNLNAKQRKELGYEPVKFWQSPFDKNRKNGSLTSMAACLVMLILCLFGMSSCHEPAPKSTDVLVAIDITTSHNEQAIPTDTVIAQFITEKLFSFHTSIRDFGKVIVSTIGEVSTQPIETIELRSGKQMLLRVEKQRKDEITNFQLAIQKAIGKAQGKISEQTNSQIFRNFCQLSSQLAHSSADRKVMLLFSDMIEHTSSRVSFYEPKYKKQPEAILADYNNLVENMERDEKIHDLTDVEVIIVHLPQKENDELFVAAKKFWEKLLTNHGAKKITFVPNL